MSSRAGGSVATVRAPWLWQATVGLSLAVATAILYLTSYKNFFYDEWDFITCARAWNASVLLQPHNEHWSTLPILAWKVLFLIVGIRSHVPFEAALLAVHVCAVLLLYLLIRRFSGDLPAFAGSISLLLTSAGGMDIVWAFQLGFVGSVAFGLLAMLVLSGGRPSPKRTVALGAALLGSLMCSAVGLAFLAAVATWIAIDSRYRGLWPAVAVSVGAFAVWYGLYGARLPGTPGAHPYCVPFGYKPDVTNSPIGLFYLVDLGQFVWSGLQATAGAVFATSDAPPLLVLLVAAALAAHLYLQRRVDSWQVALAIGLVVWFALVGLGRADRGSSGAADSHYLYIGVVFLLPLLANAMGQLSWKGLLRPALVLGFVSIAVANSAQLFELALSQTDVMHVENVELQTAQALRGAPDMKLGRSLDGKIMPQLSANGLFESSDALGSPVRTVGAQVIGSREPGLADQEILNLFGDNLKFGPDPSGSTLGMVCENVDSSAGSNIDFRLGNAASAMLQSSNDGVAFLYLAVFDRYQTLPMRRVQLSAGTQEWLRLPDAGHGVVWRIRIQTLDIGPLLACAPSAALVSRSTTFRADAATFVYGHGWSVTSDPDAILGKALKAAAGTSGPQGSFSTGFIPAPGSYDIWYRVRVSNPLGFSHEMVLGVVDVDDTKYIASTSIRPSQLKTGYLWLLIASNVTPQKGHVLKFQTNIEQRLSTDWFVDEAVMQSSGSPAP